MLRNAVLILWSAFCLLGVFRLRFTYDIDRFFPQDDPALEHYLHHKALFADDMRSLLIGVELPSEVNAEGLVRIGSLSRTLHAIDGIDDVRSLVDMADPVRLPLGEWMRVPWFSPPYADAADGLVRAEQRPELLAQLLSADQRAAVLWLQLDTLDHAAERDRLLANIRAACTNTGLPYHLAGRLVTQEHYVRATRHQLGVLGGLAVVLMLVVAQLTFRHAITALMPLAVSTIALLWTFGPLGWLAVGIEPLLSLLPALLLVLGAAFSIHILSRYRMQGGEDRVLAMRTAIRHTDRANSISAISSSVGFSTLALYPILPLRTFGWVAAFGLLAALLAARTIIPLASRWLPMQQGRKGRHRTMQSSWVFRRRTIIRACAALVLLIGLCCLPHLQVQNHFLDDLDRESRMGRDVTFFEERFAGTRPLEITVVAADSSKDLLDPRVSSSVQALLDSLGARFNVARPLGPPDLVHTAMRALHMDAARPPDAQMDQVLRKTIKHWVRAGTPMPLITADLRTGRIVGRTPDVGSATFRAHIEALGPMLNNEHVRCTITGGAWLMDQANRNIALILVQGILTAILVDALLIGLALRSWRLGLVSIGPNMIAMAFTATLLWWLGAPLKVGTAMIFPILYGVALDETVHLLMGVQHHRRRGDRRSAIVRAGRELGPALFNTTLITSVGFLLLGLSDFHSIALFGIITAVALWVALAAVLWVLPTLLRAGNPVRKEQDRITRDRSIAAS